MLLFYPILKYPGANISLSNLYELYCITYDQDFYYGLAQICKSIEKLHVVINYEESPGVNKLIEMQTQIKYVFLDGHYKCKKIIQALEKHVNSIIHLEMAQYTSSIHFLIPKLINLRYLKVVDYYYILKKFCKYLNDIHYICTKRLLEEEVYMFFISECSSIKSLNSKMLLFYPILKYPGANISLSNLYELYCITYDQDFYYGLAQICKSIEKLHVVINYEESPGVNKLIEMQTQIKYVFLDGHYKCKKIIQALEKHVNSIIHLEMAQYTSSIHFLIPKLINLRYLKVVDYYYILKKYVIYLNHHNLQVLDLHCISLDIAINIIKSTNGNLWKIRS
ncbi:unnamed protein product [Rhizophagus irregularis]|nr:unnamed protein product [Rhizophagus irregularis]